MVGAVVGVLVLTISGMGPGPAGNGMTEGSVPTPAVVRTLVRPRVVRRPAPLGLLTPRSGVGPAAAPTVVERLAVRPLVGPPLAADAPYSEAGVSLPASPALSLRSVSAELAGDRSRLTMPVDTPARPVLIDYSDAYETRALIHKVASYAIVPLFGFEYYTGRQLFNRGESAPDWMRRVHGPLAVGVAGLFAVNTVTGVWNLLYSRKDPSGRLWRTAHGVLMLLADAGFAATGITAPHFERESGVFGPGAGNGGDSGRGNRTLHRQLAISSMGVALVSYLMMLPPFRRD